MFMAQSKGVVSSLNSKHKAFLKTRQVFFGTTLGKTMALCSPLLLSVMFVAKLFSESYHT